MIIGINTKLTAHTDVLLKLKETFCLHSVLLTWDTGVGLVPFRLGTASLGSI